MNKYNARKIAETITNEEIIIMFKRARKNIKNWDAKSIVNKDFSKGVIWDILTKNFDVDKKYHVLAKTNMVREYGEYLPEHLLNKKGASE